MKDKILKEIQKMIKERFNKTIDENTILSETGIDSLSLLDLVVDAESKYNIEISDEELVAIKTVKDIVESISKKL